VLLVPLCRPWRTIAANLDVHQLNVTYSSHTFASHLHASESALFLGETSRSAQTQCQAIRLSYRTVRQARGT